MNRLKSGEADADTEARLARMRGRLLKHRAARIRPGLDDKVLADWNGLMIAALVRAGLALERPAWLTLAARAFRFVASEMARGERLGHAWRAERLTYPGFALDCAAMTRAALALFEGTGERDYLDRATTWRDVLLREYLVPDTWLLAMTAAEADPLVVRPQPSHDEAVPNANGVFAEALVRLAALTGKEEDRRRAEEAAARLSALAAASPVSHCSILNALDLHLRGVAIVVVNDADGALTETALKLPYIERTVCVVREPGALAPGHPAAALASAATGPRALACAGMRCSLPAATAEELRDRANQVSAGHTGAA